MTRFLVPLGALMLLSACGGRPVVGTSPDLTLITSGELPAAPTLPPTAMIEEQLIGPYFKLRVDVFGLEGVKDRLVTVDGAGNMSVPLAGEVRAIGLTPAQLVQRLRERLIERHMRDPQVSVSVEEQYGSHVVVEGAVNQPGTYPVRERLTLLRAIANARGTNDRASARTVLVFRTVGTTRYVAAYDLQAIRLGNYADPQIFANDTVVVSEDRARRLFADLAPIMAAPLIAVLNQL